MGYRIAIDASRNRSGGARAHLIGILNAAEPEKYNISEIHVWSYKVLLDQLPDRPWLIKHCPEVLEGPIWKQLIWQRKKFKKLIEQAGCQILLNTSAGTVSTFLPALTMSRDMLSFEKDEIARYGLGRDWLRLFVLRHVRIKSLTRSTGAIFLTKYAADQIQKWTGDITNYRVIPHGVGQVFKDIDRGAKLELGGSKEINLLYVSNVARYKHQWSVAQAVSELIQEGYNLKLTLVGGGRGPAQVHLNEVLNKIDPERQHIVQQDFLKHNQIPQKITDADIFIFASSCENMPNTLVEGMCAGIPIASSNKGPMPEVLEDGGEYFDPENIPSIKNAVKQLVDYPERANEKAKRARELSERYSWKRCADETFQYLVDTIKEQKN